MARKMKPFTKICKNRKLFALAGACALVCSLFCEVGLSQSDNNSFDGSFEDTIRDSAVAVADFQTDVQDNIGGSLEELRDKFSDAADEFGVPATDEFTATLKNAGQDILQHDSVAPWVDRMKTHSGKIELPKVLGSLAIVIGGYLGFVWLTRRVMGGGGNSGLPNEVVEVLGQTPFGPRKSLQLVRLGSKLLLLMHSPEGTSPIGEITDPDEVDYLTSVVSGRKPTGRSAIAVRKAAVTSNPPSNTIGDMAGGDLKKILRQLERTGAAAAGSVFEA